jgi:hypothetical protein
MTKGAWAGRRTRMAMRSRNTVRYISTCSFALMCVLPAQAAPPAKSAKAPPVVINIRTASDLAAACTVRPTSRTEFARLNFCNGFAQGVLQTDQQSQSATKICIPNRSPKRSDTMNEFARWVQADVSRKNELASVAFLQFMAGRFPCTS